MELLVVLLIGAGSIACAIKKETALFSIAVLFFGASWAVMV